MVAVVDIARADFVLLSEALCVAIQDHVPRILPLCFTPDCALALVHRRRLWGAHWWA